ncbi:hypothetical protein [Winogradskyella aurantiaca]|uniref:hypothetical protein n=1 Tax=Winogradskyella aurantiaca TaxID=2219558 RepID=UPI000E1C456E|nr:hypothetical protein [Winogradskyella aurantiaca]
MKRLLFLLGFCYSFSLLGQENPNKEEKLPPYQDSIYSFQSRLNMLDSKKAIVINTDPITETKTITKTPVIDQPNTKGKTIAFLKKYTSASVYKYFNGGYWLISSDTIQGYVTKENLNEDGVMESTIYNFRLKKLTEEFGKKNAIKILDNRIWYGMTKEMTRESIGEPLTITKVTGYYGLRERWNYKDQYLIFENNFLLTWNYL